MPPARQIVLVPAESGSLGTRREVLRGLAAFNTAPDGDPDTPGVAYGPGFRVELPFVGDRDPVTQALLTITEEDNAWPVLIRMCKRTGWRLMDAESGRTFGP
ncbi:MAG: hypothetical protein D6693_03285 [Planctomycetota bacterium]|nr:MAG: hypothetical protein D6693_03285 [Planctomycetota bacterium]